MNARKIIAFATILLMLIFSNDYIKRSQAAPSPAPTSNSYYEKTSFMAQGIRVTVYTDGTNLVYVTGSGAIAVK